MASYGEYGHLVEVGMLLTDRLGNARVMAIAEGYAMIRRSHAMPFVVSLKNVGHDGDWKLPASRELKDPTDAV